MSRELVNRICADLPGAENSDPWGGGHDAWKVGGKLFACVGAKLEGVSLKTPSPVTALALIESGVGLKAPYFHKSWVLIPWDALDEDALRERLHVAYDTIRGKLTKKVQATLPPWELPSDA